MTRNFRRRLSWVGATVCAVAAVAVAALRVRAHVDELALDVGATMLRHPLTDQSDPPRTLLVNGLALHVASGGTPAPLPDVLDVFHARCRERGGRLDTSFTHARGMRAGLARLGAIPLDGVLRFEGDARGYVACLDLGGAPLRPDELLRRVRTALAEGDLAHLGDLRFVFAVREGARTSYLALWTDGPLPLYRAFPPTGDAPGDDLPGVPRPPDAQRVLSAHARDEGPRVVVYRVPETDPTTLTRRYRERFRENGFVLPDVKGGGAGFIAHRGGAWFLVAITSDGPAALATVVPL